MSSGRAAKRARKKERRNVRRDEIRTVIAQRRRRRRTILGTAIVILAAVGAVIAFVTFKPLSHKKKTPSASASTTMITAPIKQPIACGAKLPAAAGSQKKQYSDPGDQRLDLTHRYILRLDTSCGRIDIQLGSTGKMPVTANSVAFLARQHFYDGLVFHRIVPGFVIQSGDPNGDGSGGSGYQVHDVPPIDAKYTRGVVAMAKGGNDQPGASGSQFFIVTGANASLPPDYALLGKVVAGDDVVTKIEQTGSGSAAAEQPPTSWVYIDTATLIDEGATTSSGSPSSTP